MLSKADLERHLCGMGVTKVAVNFHRQRSSVVVAEPTRDGWNINTSLNAPRCKQMAQIMVGDSGNTQKAAGSRQRVLAFSNRANRVLRGMRFCRQALQKDFHVSNERDGPRFWGIVGLARFNTMHRENAALQIHVRPTHLAR